MLVLRAQRFFAVGVTALFIFAAQNSLYLFAADTHSLAEASRQNNLGIAYMNQQAGENALKAFDRAHASAPENEIPEVNRGIALLSLQRTDEAQQALTHATSMNPANLYAWYNLGLLYRGNGNLQPALESFLKVATGDAADADTQYFLGDVYTQLQQYPKALEAYQKALHLNPFHASAQFGLARVYQRMGDGVKAREQTAAFRAIVDKKLGAPIGVTYGEQGRYSVAQRIAAQVPLPPAISVRFVPFTGNAGLPTANVASKTTNDHALGSGACFFDYDGDGRQDLFLPAAGPSGHAALFHNEGGGKFTDVTRASGIDASIKGIGCAAGDYDNDGKPDLAISTGKSMLLYHNQGNGKFLDSTQAVKLAVTGSPLGLTFVDYDHDGDLDLYVTGFAEGAPDKPAANQLWRNNGDNTFTEVTSETGLSADGQSLAGVLSDINNDRAVDLVVTSWKRKPSLFLNPRQGVFRQSRPWPDTMPGSSTGVTVLDFNKDGWMDLAFTHPEAPGLTLWKNVDGEHFEQLTLPAVNWKSAWGITALDFDNDGWIDLAAIAEGDHGTELRLFRNQGDGTFADVTAATGLDGIKFHEARAVIAADLDGDGATDLLITQLDGTVVTLRNEGGVHNRWMRLALTGLNDNKSALGTKVEVFAGEQHQKWEIQGSSGYLGQAPAEIVAGLGKESGVDVVRLLWPTGVIQDEINLKIASTQKITELDRRGSSCPVLFAWNGSRYQLVTDAIGAAVIGHWVGPNEYDTADPDEYIKIEGSMLQPKNGKLSLRFAEPMEEVNFIDQVRLLAIDHPADTSVFPNERFLSTPPFPEFKLITSRGAHLPAGAWDQNGRDVLPQLKEIDHRYVTGFGLTKFAGFAEKHALELGLGEWNAQHPLRLILYGFTDYFSANSMYAAWQAGLRVEAPYIEAQDANGDWKRVVDDMGFPAGLPRTIVVDLTGKLAPGTRRIRLMTSLVVYWDQILIDNSEPDASARTHEIPMTQARLAFHGYPKSEERYFPGDLDYIYEQVSATGPFARHQGIYTRYGDVQPLLSNIDNRVAIFGSGEELQLEFDAASLPPLPAGWKRDYLFYANGFVKDMDFYEAHGETVGPFPFHEMNTYPYAEGTKLPDFDLSYWLEYNYRYQSGREPKSFRVSYP